ncbi:MAG: hypothetical protein WBF53_05255 [Litorimonas sp.]
MVSLAVVSQQEVCHEFVTIERQTKLLMELFGRFTDLYHFVRIGADRVKHRHLPGDEQLRVCYKTGDLARDFVESRLRVLRA